MVFALYCVVLRCGDWKRGREGGRGKVREEGEKGRDEVVQKSVCKTGNTILSIPSRLITNFNFNFSIELNVISMFNFNFKIVDKHSDSILSYQ